MSWQVEIERKAQKTLKKIPDPYKTNIIQAIDHLAHESRPDGCTKLKGSSNLWRIRVNTYRIVYQIKDDQLIILVIRIGHRGDVYEGL
ncbi:MAG: type II toxin-antitoxin system RelE/ParE family toxin [Balneolales bacterium]